MKKTFSILCAVIMIFAFTGTAMAVDTDADCNVCKDNVTPGISCPVDQGQQFREFDHDDGDGLCDPAGKVIFDLCTCDEACDIRVGNVLGVKIEIKTKGVYFSKDENITWTGDGSDPQFNRLRFSLFPKTKITKACEASDHNPNVVPNGADDPGRAFYQVAYYKNDNMVNPIAPVPDDSLDMGVAIKDENKAKVLFVQKPGGYIINTEDAASKLCQMWIDIPKMIVNPAEYVDSMAGTNIKIRISAFTEAMDADRTTGNTISNVDTANPHNYDKAYNTNTGEIVDSVVINGDGNIYSTPATGGIMLWNSALSGAARVVAPTPVASIGTGIPAKVDEKWVTFARYLCPDCHTPCGCDFIVAKFCCDATQYGMLFPYFAPDNDESYFWNGFVLSNLALKDGVADITIYEMDGDIGTATVNVPAKGIYNALLRNIPDLKLAATGTGDTAGTLGNSKAYMWVCTNFLAHGFAMLSDNAGMGESMGYLPVTSSDRSFDGSRNGWNLINSDADRTILNCN